MDADYSVALTLLLKYPAPADMNGPQAFVEDAVYLKEHLDASGGSDIIAKYSGRPPSANGSLLSSAAVLTPKQNVFLRRSPLPSPASFLRQQGGVSALIQGAAKDVFERGEKLGINKAVRDAMDEVKKNMEGLAAPPTNDKRPSDVSRWSLDDGRSIPSTRKLHSATETRNRQLGLMLEEALKDLRKASAAITEVGSMATDAIDIAIAKIQFVQVYLADSSMPLPSAEQDKSTVLRMSPLIGADYLSKPASPIPSVTPQMTARHLPSRPPRKDSPASRVEQLPIDDKTNIDARRTVPTVAGRVEVRSMPLERPQAPMPTRSTLAQSSFAWMLESEDDNQGRASKAAKARSSNTFSHARKSTSGPSREKAAFLFGEDADESENNDIPRKQSLSQNPDEGFNLGTMKVPTKG